MSVVVTGAAGFIGRHVVHTLLRRGAEVATRRRRDNVVAGERVLAATPAAQRAAAAVRT